MTHGPVDAVVLLPGYQPPGVQVAGKTWMNNNTQGLINVVQLNAY